MASRGINKAIILGNLGQDPETRYMPNGNAVTNITVATSMAWKDQSGQPQEKTEWHRITFFGKLAEIASQYLKKGSKVYIEGRIETKKYQDQAGVDKYTTSIIANEMQMLDSKGDDQQGGQQQAPNQNQQAPRQQNYQQAPQQRPAQQNQGQQPQGMDDFDVPF